MKSGSELAVGILYAALAGMLLLCSFLRARHSQHDFADVYKDSNGPSKHPRPLPTKGQENKQNFGRPFITAGWVVLAVAGVVGATEVGMLVLILTIS